jgi:hypothetical protein
VLARVPRRRPKPHLLEVVGLLAAEVEGEAARRQNLVAMS